MKQLKSTLSDIRQLFDQSLTVRHVAEFLIAFEADHSGPLARKYMEEKKFDIIGVRHQGVITGFACRTELQKGPLRKYTHPFDDSDLLPETLPLLETMEALRNAPQKFVLMLGQVAGIVTRGDMQKAPVRMWLFGLITLVEMQILRLIRTHHPEESWKCHLSDERIKKALQLYDQRQHRGEEIDLADCLQFCDKRQILFKTPELRAVTEIAHPGGLATSLIKLEQVRDKLAHAQDIITGFWPELVDLAAAAENILQRCEDAIEKDLSIRPFDFRE